MIFIQKNTEGARFTGYASINSGKFALPSTRAHQPFIVELSVLISHQFNTDPAIRKRTSGSIRKGRDSNSRSGFPNKGFQDLLVRPLRHPSQTTYYQGIISILAGLLLFLFASFFLGAPLFVPIAVAIAATAIFVFRVAKSQSGDCFDLD